ncbi:triose-phosphate isomerase [Vogesella sp. LIG4]|uniref:triose-phosphate isomerase n=1 Tax=Vogesella sp. LIG4 TaxID=1192162 RepID=UPI00081FE69D|nr:triose-phosphate isomerase [Vogesella sp. LIG4]SCK08294.1 triosephosphate isomerase [Vogesella sp. LIG4]
MQAKLVLGNWKMNGRHAANVSLLQSMLDDADINREGVGIAAPYPYLAQLAAMFAGSKLAVAAQDVSRYALDGAFTGEVCASMLADMGCRYVLVGHSERRQYFGENDACLREKLQAAVAAGMVPVYCVGETLEEREAGRFAEVVGEQLKTLDAIAGQEYVVAYEPVWAIGTGRVASIEQIDAAHQLILERVLQCHGASASIRVLYGGSVKADNADAILSLASVGGALVGGASLEIKGFGKICQSAKKTL